MSRHRRHRNHSHGQANGRDTRGCLVGGPIKRVINGLGDAFGLSRGTVIAAFVIGFIFLPLLTTLMFLATLYWVSYPNEAKRHFERISSHVKRAASRMQDTAFSQTRRHRQATEPDFDDVDFDVHRQPAAARGANTQTSDAAEVRRKFERLEQRANAIEAYVASEEYRLQSQFDDLADEDSKPTAR